MHGSAYVITSFDNVDIVDVNRIDTRSILFEEPARTTRTAYNVVIKHRVFFFFDVWTDLRLRSVYYYYCLKTLQNERAILSS